jgi:predicted AlkP superfamily pyrophosphatase or phosphodiesterase
MQLQVPIAISIVFAALFLSQTSTEKFKIPNDKNQVNFINDIIPEKKKDIQKKILIIGIDGCKPDALLKANTKNIDRLWKRGAYSFNTKTDEISSSGICWTGMLTGVWHNKHNVISNNYKAPNITEYPHFFRRVKEYNPNLQTFSIVHWGPLHKILQEGDADVFEVFDSDEDVTNEVVRKLLTKDVDVMFVHLDDVDHAGHTFGYGTDVHQYIKAIETKDEEVGRIISALKKRSNYKNESWLILVSTDHGGSEKSHGKNIPEHTTIFYIASGKSVKKGKIEKQVNIIDVAVTALTHLGISIKEEWKLDGKPAGLKRN